MPPFVLTVLKIVFLALLYFFVFRAFRSVVVDLRAPAPGAPQGQLAAQRAPRQSSRGRGPRSIVVTDDRGAKLGTHSLNGTLQIGRAEACHIQISDTYASQFHARIYSRDDSWWVEDLGSTNGTYLNQRRITSPSALRAGDRLKIGKTTLEVRR